MRLLAKNNDVLATATTESDGRANFDAGLARGSGGLAPGVVVAEDGKGDYGFLDLVREPFDLTDRGVKGRLPPKGLDAFVSTERGVYRTGETVNVTKAAGRGRFRCSPASRPAPGASASMPIRSVRRSARRPSSSPTTSPSAST